MSAEIIEFPSDANRHGLSELDIASLRRWISCLPEEWTIETRVGGEFSTMWVRLRNSWTDDCPVFGFTRKRGLIWIVVQIDGLDDSPEEWEAPYPTVDAAMTEFLAVVDILHSSRRTPDRPAC